MASEPATTGDGRRPGDLSIVESLDGDTLVLALIGEMDMATAPSVLARVSEAIKQGGLRVRIELGGVEFMDSTGVAALIECHGAVDGAGGSMQVVCPDGEPRRVLALTGVDQLFGLDEAAPQASGR